MNRIRRRRAWPTGRPRRILTIMIKIRKNLCPTGNSKNIKAKKFANNNFQGNKNNSPSNQNSSKGKEYANNHGNYTEKFERKEPIKCWEMAHTMPQSILIKKRLSVIFILYRRR